MNNTLLELDLRFEYGVKVFCILTILATILSCSSHINKKTNDGSMKSGRFLKSTVLVFRDGEYKSGITDEKPLPLQGEDQFYRDMFLDLRYPASARKHGIQGSVLFEIEIDENGDVINIKKLNSLSIDCDNEAELALKRAVKSGFEPFILDGVKVKIKYLLPVNFRLG